MKLYKKGISLSVEELNALQHILNSGIHNALMDGCNTERFNLLQGINDRLSEARVNA